MYTAKIDPLECGSVLKCILNDSDVSLKWTDLPLSYFLYLFYILNVFCFCVV